MTSSRLHDWIAAARTDVGQRSPDPMIEQQLLSRVRERRALQSVAAVRTSPRAPAARTRWWQRWPVLVPVAVVLALATFGVRMLGPNPSPSVIGARATPFFALVGTDAIAAEPAPIVVSSRVARSALADYGLPVDPARVDEPVGAEFLVSSAGVVLAVRFRE